MLCFFDLWSICKVKYDENVKSKFCQIKRSVSLSMKALEEDKEKAAGEKSVEMIHVKDINKITGYIRGGCTAIGMKKDYPTVLDESANAQEKIIVSGGKNGIQIELTTEDYLKACKGKTADITLR